MAGKPLRRAKTARQIRKIRKFALTSRKFTPQTKILLLASQNMPNSSMMSASPIRTNLRRRILLHSTTQPNTIPRLASTTVRIRAPDAAISIVAETAVETVAAIVAAAAVGAVEADAVVADALRKAAGIFLLQSTQPRKAVSATIVAATKIVATAAASTSAALVAISTIARKALALASPAPRPAHPPRWKKKRSCCPANRSQNSAIALSLLRPLRQSRNLFMTNRNPSFPKTNSRAAQISCPARLPVLAVPAVPFPAGCWLVVAQKLPK